MSEAAHGPGALPTLAQLGFDGRQALKAILEKSIYRTAAQALASLTLFSHPQTVAQIPGRGALFPAVRNAKLRRTLGEINGVQVGFDDNEVAHHAFRWCNPSVPFGRDVQLNHIWSRSSDPACFTALANLCVAPSFLAKLTDHDENIAALLRRRAFELYHWRPLDEPEPAEPADYGELIWAEPLPPVGDLQNALRQRLRSRPKSTAAQVARRIGWAFTDFRPDSSLPDASD